MEFSRLAEYFQQLEASASRLKITAILAELFRESSVAEVKAVCYLSQGRVLPSYYGLEFQMAEKMMVKAIAQALALKPEEVMADYKKRGDLGETVERLRQIRVEGHRLFSRTGKPKSLTVSEVYQRLLVIARDGGQGSAERKIARMSSLIAELDGLSSRFLVRIPLGKMRLGFSDLTILDALSWMISGDKSWRPELERAYEVRADVGEVARQVKGSAKPVSLPGGIEPQLGIPVLPALCQRLGTVEEMVAKLGVMAVEPKYDGQRLQLHYRQVSRSAGGGGDWEVRLFTRSLENVSEMFPDIAQAASRELKANSVILDGEAIGVNERNGRFLPFQETIKRKRKHGIAAVSREIPLKYFAFDVLFKDGKSLLDLPFAERRRILTESIKAPRVGGGKSYSGATIWLSPQIVTDQIERLREYHDQQTALGLEGVVLKKWQAPYDPGRRGFTWVKFKQEAGKKGGGLADTIDGVVMGVYRGRGKRADFGLGAFLMGIKRGEKIVTLTKIGTGLSDDQFRQMKAQSAKYRVSRQPKEYEVDKNLTPDLWCRPGIVVEVQADNVTKSPLHSAGLALRFPRLIRFRPDKNPGQISSLAELERLFQIQTDR